MKNIVQTEVFLGLTEFVCNNFILFIQSLVFLFFFIVLKERRFILYYIMEMMVAKEEKVIFIIKMYYITDVVIRPYQYL